MNTLSYKTQFANKETIIKDWYVIDVDGLVLGRAASKIALVLRGKNKPSFTPHSDCGDNIIVINAEKVVYTGNKENEKEYITHSGYPGGQKMTLAKDMRKNHPTRIIENAVRGMIPRNRLGREVFRNLYVYAGGDHPHQAQKPKELKLAK